MLFNETPKEISQIRELINNAYRQDEAEIIENLLQHNQIDAAMMQNIEKKASELVKNVRKNLKKKSSIDSFMCQYDLSSNEGIALMCLAEALLRIPDKETVDRLIQDKITKADWDMHLGQSKSLFVNAATWGLMLTGKIYSKAEARSNIFGSTLKKLIGKGGEPVIRKAVEHAMKILGKQFVMGQDINEAMTRAKEQESKGFLYSYDMLGEVARTQEDAERYFIAYQNAITAIGKSAAYQDVTKSPGISIKLSALHPRYEFSQKQRVIAQVTPRLKILAIQAKKANVGLTVDAEEADRLDLSLDIIEKVFLDEDLDNWNGLGLALQSYQKRAWYLIDWLVALAKIKNKRWMVRLIKGAYWDSEIKKSQELGLEGYPVFTRKMNTDVSFICCAQKLLQFPEAIYPQFATHNAHSVATVLEIIGERTDYEFQCLHGMGQALYDQIVGLEKLDRPCRIYAPVGSYEDLLPYLVRRLLENGANTSFVNRLVDAKQPIEQIVADPISKVRRLKSISHVNIPKPQNIFGDSRENSQGIDLSNRKTFQRLESLIERALTKKPHAEPTSRVKSSENKSSVLNPFNGDVAGSLIEANEEDIKRAIEKADEVAFAWEQTPVSQRAACLEKAADLFEQHQAELMALAIKEAGKTIPDAISEVREAVDFCRYYAVKGREYFSEPEDLPGPTGELNQLSMHGRGPMVCISPWNFPLAIFTGQVTAALVAGNPVIAKPANQTPLIAAKAVELLHQAGIPKEVLQLLPTKGSSIGQYLMTDKRVQGVVFTGSTETAQTIQQTLVNRGGAIVPLIAETGGQNAMIVDSSALPEQVVLDVIASAFNSAGQRCSALRVLFVQEDIADKLIAMLKGAMQELVIGDPSLLNTDVGPVIDKDAQQNLNQHIDLMHAKAKCIYQKQLPQICTNGTFVAPVAFELPNLDLLTHEVFGPVLHVIRYKSKDLDNVIESINNTGFGLTLGIHTRVEETANYIQQRVKVGNSYMNRNMIGAVVGVQPFGGEGLSGTGPKAGGPHYLLRMCHERTLSVNTSAAGGNASLMCLEDGADL